MCAPLLCVKSIAAEHARLVDLLLRRGHRHEDHALATEMPAHESEALRVISGRGADKKAGIVAGSKRLSEEIQRTANLVGTYRRQILALQINACAIFARQVVVLLQRGYRENLPYGFRSGCDPVGEACHVVFPVS
jgi:hypothetical protein